MNVDEAVKKYVSEQMGTYSLLSEKTKEFLSPGEIPFRVRRRFACLAGLLEIADREFESLRQDEMAVRQAIESRIKKVKIDT